MYRGKIIQFNATLFTQQSNFLLAAPLDPNFLSPNPLEPQNRRLVLVNEKKNKWHTVNSIPRRFHPNSPLHLYLRMKFPKTFPDDIPVYSLDTICTKLVQIIMAKQLLDTQNDSIILCDKELEMALRTKYLDASQLKEYICKQMCPGLHIDVKLIIDYFNLLTFGTLPPPKINPIPAAKEEIDEDSITYCLNPDFLRLLRQSPDVPKFKMIFTYKEIANAIYSYLRMDLSTWEIDPRNKEIAYIKNNPLGKIFQVDAFYKKQLRYLISRVARQVNLNSYITIKKKYATL